MVLILYEKRKKERWGKECNNERQKNKGTMTEIRPI
jgi:hypothetical protein